VSIGAYDARGPALGVIHVPVLTELFSAARGEGAALNGRPLRLGPAGGMGGGLLGIGANDRVPAERVSEMLTALTKAGASWVRYGSGALMLAYVAAGRLLGYAEPRMCAWDCMAGYCLIEAAGGRVLPFAGGPAMQDAAAVLGAQTGIYDELLALCRFDDGAFWTTDLAAGAIR
jgi:myo-inositol-1(or 4)-monophosphatase